MPLNRRHFIASATASASAVGLGAMAGCSSDDDAKDASPKSDPSGPLEDLAKKLEGKVLLPDDDGYASSSAAKNGRFMTTRPVAVAEVANAEDVATCVKWCAENGVSPVPRGGGHSYAGFSSTNGLIVSLAKLNEVKIDKNSGVATVGGSALNRDLFGATKGGNTILPGGTCLGVGLGGLALGGGIGYNCRWGGLTQDHMTSTEIVVADGSVLTASAKENKDLFWACRGGAGGTFGINTSFEFQTLEIPRKTISYYDFTWKGVEAAGAVLAAFDALMHSCPDALNPVAWAQATEVGSGGPKEAIHVESRGLFMGSKSELADVVAPLIAAAGKPLTQEIEEKPFWDVQAMRVSEESDSHSWGDISRYATKPVPAEVYAALAEQLAECPHRSDSANGAIWSLGWVGGGVVGKFARDETAYVHRDAATLLRPTTVWPNDADPAVPRSLEAWADQVLATLDPHTPAESYQNFPNRLIADWGSQYYAENFNRLVRVKSDVDPTNLFNNPQSIPPNPGTLPG